MFSMIIPTYNNLAYLKLCLSSIAKNSSYQHEIIVHVNEGTDGTLAYVIKEGIKHTYSKNNVGVCTAVNTAAAIATTDYILYCHDDMYLCPKWDEHFHHAVTHMKTHAFYLSGSMIEQKTGHVQLDCGSDNHDFNEQKLLDHHDTIDFHDHQGTHWAPHLIHKTYWNKVGGFSEAFNPGEGSDPDLNMKLWQAGVRIFKGLGQCRVYHFSSTTLRKKAWNDGATIFLLKWGISIKFFKKFYLRSDTIYKGELTEPNKTLHYYMGLIKCKLAYAYLLLGIKLHVIPRPIPTMSVASVTSDTP